MNYGIIFFAVSAILLPLSTHAETVPSHIASMTKQLLSATKSEFSVATGDDEQAARLQRVYQILRREGLYNWGQKTITREGFEVKMASVFGMQNISIADEEKLEHFLEAQTGGRASAAIDELYTALSRERLAGAARTKVINDWSQLWRDTWADTKLTHELESIRGPEIIKLVWDMTRARYFIQQVNAIQ